MLCCCMLQGFSSEYTNYTDENGITWMCEVDIEKDSARIYGATACPEELRIPDKIKFDSKWITVKTISGSLWDRTFENKDKIKKVILPNTLTTIDGSTFNGWNMLSSINLESCKNIGREAFVGCYSLKEITLSEEIRTLGYKAFGAIEKVTINATKIPSFDGGLDGNTIIFVPQKMLNSYKTADNWNNYPKQLFAKGTITDYDVTTTALDNAPGLLQQLNRDSLNYIVNLKVSGTINGYDIMLFRNKMDNLHNLDLSDADIVANPYEYYEGNCTQDSILGDNAFTNLDKLTSIYIPKSIKAIGNGTFDVCI